MAALTALLGLTLLAGGAPASVAQEAMGSTDDTTVAAVDINRADAAQLAETLTGVGQSRAEAIVRYREQFGPFESVEELSEVQGIGMATVERNRQRIRLR